jgi:hypothetical protein
MTRILPLALALAQPGLATVSPDEQIPQETQAATRMKFEAQGYELRQIDGEEGLCEAHALTDGERYERKGSKPT